MEATGRLVGVALDVSGSMQISLKNDGGSDLSRFGSIREVFEAVAARFRSLVELDAIPTNATAVEIFIYAFGLRHLPRGVCDLMSLLEIAKDFEPAQLIAREFTDPLEELQAIASQHGREGWGAWIAENITTTEATNLVWNLRVSPVLANALVRLLPNFSSSEIRHALVIREAVEDPGGKSFWARMREARALARSVRKGEVSGKRVATELVRAGGKEAIERQISEAQFLVRRLTTAPMTRDDLFVAFHREIGGPIWNRLEQIGDTTVPVTAVASQLSRALDGQGFADDFIYGNTPMCAALRETHKRFRREMVKAPGRPLTLLIVSDGYPTDGDPIPIADAIRSMGVDIIACLVTDRDMQEPRVLPAKQGKRWTRNTRTMYKLASVVSPDSTHSRRLQEWGWTVPRGARAFAQVNHSSVLSEFLRSALG
jgi:hypothetical protein